MSQNNTIDDIILNLQLPSNKNHLEITRKVAELTFIELFTLKNEILKNINSYSHNLSDSWLKYCGMIGAGNHFTDGNKIILAKLSYIMAEWALSQNYVFETAKKQKIIYMNIFSNISPRTPKQISQENVEQTQLNKIIKDFLYLQNRNYENNLKFIEFKFSQPDVKSIVSQKFSTELDNINIFNQTNYIPEEKNANFQHLKHKIIYLKNKK